ncbi:MAG: peptidoglycan DD-metalloendopeptidase family protein [Betaproteobacteria bacterium]|nr:peptidoglycan DD-metalloendopeptidase family protein [Betaproteobacteria bacterium]
MHRADPPASAFRGTRRGVILLALLLSACGASQVAAPVRDTLPGKAAKASYAPAPAGQHRVQPGDTLYKIAFEHGLDYRQLAAWNGIADPARIRAGDALRVLPPPRPAAVVTTAAAPERAGVEDRELARSVDTRPVPSQARVEPRPLPAEPTAQAASHPVALNEPQDAAPEVWAWPSRGDLLIRYGEGLSKGIDIAGKGGQPVQAAATGRVVYAGSGLRGYGKLIIIRHGQTLLSAYAHNARIHVTEGQKVARGQVIAEMGDSDADRVKLHFEIRESGKPVDPLGYLPKTG